MKFSINRDKFLKSLAYCQGVIEKRNTLPILSNILIEAKNNCLRITATDLDLIFINIIENVNIEIEGSTTTSSSIVYDIIRKLPDSSKILISKQEDQDHLTISSGKSNFKLQTLPRSDFPEISNDQYTHTFTIVSGELNRLIEKTRFAISNEETRYYLNGIYLHESEAIDKSSPLPTLRTVSTDGHRLAQAELPLPDGSGGMPGVIIPRKAISEILKLYQKL